MKDIDRIIIAEKGKYYVFGDLRKCKTCDVNFTAIQPCFTCALRIEKEKELGRRLTKEEFRELFSFFRNKPNSSRD